MQEKILKNVTSLQYIRCRVRSILFFFKRVSFELEEYAIDVASNAVALDEVASNTFGIADGMADGTKGGCFNSSSSNPSVYLDRAQLGWRRNSGHCRSRSQDHLDHRRFIWNRLRRCVPICFARPHCPRSLPKSGEVEFNQGQALLDVRPSRDLRDWRMRPLRPEQHPAVRQRFEVQQREARRRLLERRSGAWNFKQDAEEDEAGEKRVIKITTHESFHVVHGTSDISGDLTLGCVFNRVCGNLCSNSSHRASRKRSG